MRITLQEIITLLPILIIGATVIVIMIFSIFNCHSEWISFLCVVIGLSVSFFSINKVWNDGEQHVFQLLYVNSSSVLYSMLVLLSSLVCSILGYQWLSYYSGNRDTFYLLLLISCMGGILLTVTNHFVILFLGIELLSLPLFALIGYSYIQKFSLQASIRYVVLSGISSSFLLLGIALIYSKTACLSFYDIHKVLDCIMLQYSPVLLIGLSLVIIGFGLKLSFVPFHLWISDIYQHTAYPVLMYLMTGSKIAVISVFIRFFLLFSEHYYYIFYIYLSVIACCSMLFGNLIAVRQNNIKRILAYSSISQIGYLLIAIIALRLNLSIALETIALYLISDFIGIMGMFGIISIMSNFFKGQDTDLIYLYRGLFWYYPMLSIMFTIVMLSVSGIPLTVGFIGKFYLLILGVSNELWWCVIFTVISSVFGIFCYLKIIISLYFYPFNRLCCNISTRNSKSWLIIPGGIVSVCAFFSILLFGLCPQTIIGYICIA